MLSAARLAEIQAEYHADDIEIDPARMARWSEARVRAYLEAGASTTSLWKRASARDVAGSSNSNGSGRDESPRPAAALLGGDGGAPHGEGVAALERLAPTSAT